MGDRLRAGKISRYVATQVNSAWPSLRWGGAMSGKITVGLASHWPCVTDNTGSGLSTAYVREMSTPHTFLRSMALLHLLYLHHLIGQKSGSVMKETCENIRNRLPQCYVERRMKKSRCCGFDSHPGGRIITLLTRFRQWRKSVQHYWCMRVT